MTKLSSKFPKGISPLIAAVLLIAFTMTIAAILATWAQTFGEERLGEAGEKGQEAIDCPQLSLDIETASWNSGENRVEDAVVWNRMGKNISSIRFVIYDADGPNFLDVNASDDDEDEVLITPGSFQRLHSESDDTIDMGSIERLELHVEPQKCPDVQPIDWCEGLQGEDFLC